LYQITAASKPLTKGLQPPDPRHLCPLSSTEFVEPLPPQKRFLGTPLGSPTLFIQRLPTAPAWSKAAGAWS